MKRQAKVSWGGPGTPFVTELSPLLAGQLALLMETPEVVAAIAAHPTAYAGITELHDGLSEALGDYGERFWEERDLFPMQDLPRKRAVGVVRVPGQYHGRGTMLEGL